jgi:hypothetical protein
VRPCLKAALTDDQVCIRDRTGRVLLGLTAWHRIRMHEACDSPATLADWVPKHGQGVVGRLALQLLLFLRKIWHGFATINLRSSQPQSSPHTHVSAGPNMKTFNSYYYQHSSPAPRVTEHAPKSKP